jgi:uncharacterized protein (TIGR02147 family)
MQTEIPYYITKLKEDFSRRQRKSSSYSMRAFARDLGVHHAALSAILSGKRGLPLKSSQHVIEKLGLGPKERTLFFDSLFKAKSHLDNLKIDPNDERLILDESYFTVIAEWEHYAILTMFDLDNFTPEISVMAKRLRISETRVSVVLNNLVTCGLLSPDKDGILEKSQPKVRTTEDVTSTALKHSHLDTLELGKKKLEEVDVIFRDFSSANWAVDPEKIPEAKIIIREFRQKMASLFKEGNKTEVFQLAIQLYPLTQSHHN